MIKNFDLQKKIKEFPDSPGVYLMKNEDNQIIYVGKARSLRKRVSSYFTLSEKDWKTSLLLKEIKDIEIIQTDTEIEAFLLEAKFIKKIRPKYNIDMKDGKTYPVIAITKEMYPTVLITRDRTLQDVEYYGPFVDLKALRHALSLLQDIFKFRTCKKKITKPASYKKPCLKYSMGKCMGPCINNVDIEVYNENIKALKSFLKGNKESLLAKLEKRMFAYSRNLDFENAALIRDQIKGIKNLETRSIHTDSYFEVNLKDGLEDLKKIFSLKSLPSNIEGIDISHISGEFAVGVVVVFKEAMPLKSEYRRYKIKNANQLNDYDMIKEVVFRRYSRLEKEEKSFPDIILIDGGIGQVNSAYEVLKGFGIEKVLIVGIAKPDDRIFVVNKKDPLNFDGHTNGLNLLKNIRDEAHRFANAYRSILQKKALIG